MRPLTIKVCVCLCTRGAAVLTVIGVLFAFIANLIINWSHQVIPMFTAAINVRWSPWTACYGGFYSTVLNMDVPAACNTGTWRRGDGSSSAKHCNICCSEYVWVGP